MNSKEPGYVYILTNPSFREDWVKIGKSSRPVDVRSKELDNTAVPLPFEIFATIKTVKYNEVEKLVHKNIDRLSDLRIRQNREFFNVPLRWLLTFLMILQNLLMMLKLRSTTAISPLLKTNWWICRNARLNAAVSNSLCAILK